MQKTVGSNWEWFTDYVYVTAKWTLNAESGRHLEVGLGIKAFGRPRGERVRFRDHVEFTTVGVGAIHVRVIDRKGPCVVQLDQGEVGLIRVIKRSFP
jgi:hypothetical protein